MKKLSLFLLLIAGLNMAHAQVNPATDAFTKYSVTINTDIKQAAKANNNKQVLELITSWIQEYDHQQPDIQKQFKDYLYGMYYNKACYHALDNDKEMAITSFQKASDAGYSNYAHTLKDTDLDALREDNRFKSALNEIRNRGDYGYILKTSGSYLPKVYPALPKFTYQNALATELVTLRNKFNLDSVRGHGDEVSQIKNLLYWVHNVVKHDGNSNNPSSKNAVDLIEVCQKENRGLNCRMLATILKDVYQAEGFASRVVTCRPKDTADFDCHVINVVWSKSLKKWLWMDPTNNAFVSDDAGNLLSISEVRARLINDQPIVLNEDANWNNQEKQTKENYLDSYMSKNLYWLQCSVKSEWDLETSKEDKAPNEYVNLYPGKYSTIEGSAKSVTKDQIYYATGDSDRFWSKPELYHTLTAPPVKTKF